MWNLVYPSYKEDNSQGKELKTEAKLREKNLGFAPLSSASRIERASRLLYTQTGAVYKHECRDIRAIKLM